MACVPQYLSDSLGDLSRRSGQFVPKVHSAIEHLTRSRLTYRTPESFSCRFLSWPVRQRPPVSLYAIPARAVSRKTRSVPRLHTPSRGSLSAMPAAIPAGVSGSVRVIACPSDSPLCSRKAICPENLATERPDASSVPTGHLVLDRAKSRRQRLPVRAEIRSRRRQAGRCKPNKARTQNPAQISAAALTYLCRRYILRVWTVCGD